MEQRRVSVLKAECVSDAGKNGPVDARIVANTNEPEVKASSVQSCVSVPIGQPEARVPARRWFEDRPARYMTTCHARSRRSRDEMRPTRAETRTRMANRGRASASGYDDHHFAEGLVRLHARVRFGERIEREDPIHHGAQPSVAQPL